LYFEIDGASNRGIQEIRELKEKLRFLPTSSKYKIVIIDEVHMLTTEAFNALLKTLEEPPAHVYFMFATTELHKIPITILSRCQRYELTRVSSSELSDHFSKLAADEGYEIDDDGLAMIVKESEGSVRDGLSLMDQVFSYSEKTISVDDVIEVLGLINRQVLLTITSALLEGNSSKALTALDECFDYGIDLKRFTGDLLGCFRNLLLFRIKGCNQLLDLPEQEKETFQQLSQTVNAETIHMKLNLLMHVVEELRYSSQPRLTLETGFLKVIEASNVVPVSALLGKLDGLIDSDRPAEQPYSAHRPAPSLQESKKKTAQPPGLTEEKVKPPSPQIAEQQDNHPPKTVPVEPPPPIEDDNRITASDAHQQQKQKTIKPQPHERDIRRHWNEFIDYVKDRKNWMAMDLQRADIIKEDNGSLLLQYDDQASCALLQKETKLLTEFVLDFFQKDLKVRFVLPDRKTEDMENNGESPKQQRQLLANDPLVSMAAEIFDGQIGDIRVGPRFRKP